MLRKLTFFSVGLLIVLWNTFLVAIFSWSFLIPLKLRRKILTPSATRLWILGILKLCLIKIYYRQEDNLANKQNLPQEPIQNIVIISNHNSFIDIPILMRICHCVFVMKAMLLKTPFGWGAKMVGAIPVVRGNKKSYLQTIEGCRSRLADEIPVCFFPEGTRSHSQDILPLKKGLLSFYFKQKQPMLILGIYGTHLIIPPRKLEMKLGLSVGVSAYTIINPEEYSTFEDFHKACYLNMVKAKQKSIEILQTSSKEDLFY